MSDESGRFAYSTFSPLPGSESGPIITFLMAERGQTGWSGTPVSFPYSIYDMDNLFFDLLPIFPGAFSRDLDTAAWTASVPLTPDGPPEGQFGLYRKTTGLAPEFIAKIGAGTLPFEHPGFVDISSDGSRIVFMTAEHLLPVDASRTSGESIYAWNGGNLRMVDVDNGGTLVSACGATVSPANGMSSSASRVFFSVPECGGTEKVYVRDLENDATTEISASQCTRLDCNPPANVSFAGATRDGDIALLTTSQQLTNDDYDASNDLYRYDASTGGLELLSGGSGEASGEVTQARIYPSDDGNRVYFVGVGEVLPDEIASGEKLFLADSSGVHLVAELSLPPTPEIQVSADGGRVVFASQSQLLASDTDTESDVYAFEAEDETLSQISLGPAGGNGAFGALISSPIERPELQSSGNYQPFYAIDGSGERIVFATSEGLVSEDVNAKMDVYEWWNGQLGLISTGRDPFDSAAGGISRDGRSVLFVTNETLTSADVDGGNRDLYVARLEGGFHKPGEPQGCDVRLCPGPARETPIRPTPDSMSLPPRKIGRLRVIGIRSTRAGVVGPRTTVLAVAPSPGLVTASVWIRARGKKVVLAAGRLGVVRPGRIRVDLRLTHAGRRLPTDLARRGHLMVSDEDSTVSQPVKLALG